MRTIESATGVLRGMVPEHLRNPVVLSPDIGDDLDLLLYVIVLARHLPLDAMGGWDYKDPANLEKLPRVSNFTDECESVLREAFQVEDDPPMSWRMLQLEAVHGALHLYADCDLLDFLHCSSARCVQ